MDGCQLDLYPASTLLSVGVHWSPNGYTLLALLAKVRMHDYRFEGCSPVTVQGRNWESIIAILLSAPSNQRTPFSGAKSESESESVKKAFSTWDR